jgi:hypothetical protein
LRPHGAERILAAHEALARLGPLHDHVGVQAAADLVEVPGTVGRYEPLD